ATCGSCTCSANRVRRAWLYSGAAFLGLALVPAEAMSAETFRQLAAAGHNRIPVAREVLSDLDTPLSVYLKLADRPHTYLFESVAWIEPRLASGDLPDELGTPDALLLLSEEVAVFDNLAGRLYLVVHADPAEPQAYARAVRRLDALVHRLRHAGASYPDVLDPSLLREADFVSGFSREGFIAAVEKSKEYIRAGDVFQVVLSQ